MKKWFVPLSATLLILGACSADETIPKEEPKEAVKEDSVKKEETNTENTPSKTNDDTKMNWQEQVKKIAATNSTETEKHDEVMMFAKDYKPSEAELSEFEAFIVEEFKSGKYLSDITNHEYMLSNLFKSRVVELANKEESPMRDFAFDFLQNTKYTYRGVDAVDSSSVKSNEEQMQKALAKM